MFNTKTAQFAWKNLTVIIEGRPVLGITDIEYGPTKNLEAIYGAGDNPQFIGEGNKAYAGTVEMLQADFEALIEEARKRGGIDHTDLEVSITVAYIPKEATQLPKTVVDRLSGVKFSGNVKKFTQGDTHMKVSMPFMCLAIEPQI